MWTTRLWNDRLQLVSGPSSGPPLLLLHGVSRSGRTFTPLLPALWPFWTVTLLDQRGHGGSRPAADGRYFVTDYVSDAIAVLRDLHEPVVLYGHSLGAMVAAGVAAELPNRVRALVLEDPPFETMGRRIFETRLHSQFAGMQAFAGSSRSVREVAAGLAEIRLIDPAGGAAIRFGDVRDAASLRLSASCLKSVDPAVFEPIVAGAWLDGYDRERILKRIDCPTLLLQADATVGGMWPDDDAVAVERQLNDVVRVRFPGAAHLIHGTRTQDLANTVTAFLSSLSAT